MIRVRHYTRRSSKERILAEARIVARDQNKIFVERAYTRPLSARDAEARYFLARGKGGAYVEFDVTEAELKTQLNPLTGRSEFFVVGNVLLEARNAHGFDNH